MKVFKSRAVATFIAALVMAAFNPQTTFATDLLEGMAADPLPEPAGEAPLTSIDISVGARYFDLPDTSLGRAATPDGALDLSSDLDGWGPSLDVTLRRYLGLSRTFIEGYAFVSGLDTESLVRPSLGSQGVVGITGITAGGAASDFVVTTTFPDSLSVTGEIIGINAAGEGAAIAPILLETFSPASQVGLAETLLDATAPSSGVLNLFASLDASDGLSATAIGMALTDLGFAVAAAGDLSGVTLTNRYSSDVLYYGAEFRIGVADLIAGPVYVSPFVGPAFRSYEQDLLSSATIISPTVTLSGGDLQGDFDTEATINIREDLDGRYFGVSGGAHVSTPLTDRLDFKATAGMAALLLDADYRGRQSASVDTVFGNVIDVFGPAISDDDRKLAFLAHVGGGFAIHIGAGEIGLTGMVEYLSDVPTVERSDPISISADADGFGQTSQVQTGDIGPTRATSGLGYTDMMNFGFNVRYTLEF